jgi:hypothetical protein
MKAQSAICCIQLQNWDEILHVGQDICNSGNIINSDMDSEMHPISWNAIIMIQQWEFRWEQNTEKAAWTTNNKGNIVYKWCRNACDLESILCCDNHPIKLRSILDLLNPSL